MFEPKRMGMGNGEGLTMRSFIVCTVYVISLEDYDGQFI